MPVRRIDLDGDGAGVEEDACIRRAVDTTTSDQGDGHASVCTIVRPSLPGNRADVDYATHRVLCQVLIACIMLRYEIDTNSVGR